MILLPFLVSRLIEFFFKNKKEAFFGFLQDLFIASEVMVLFALWPHHLVFKSIFWSLLALYQLAAWYCAFRLEIPLTFDLWSYALHPSSFADSAKELKVFQTGVLGVALVLFSLVGVEPRPSFLFWFMCLAIGCLGARSKGVFSNPFFEIQWRWLWLPKKKSQTAPYKWEFPQEIHRPLSIHYPLLRKTLGFKGEKRFEIPTSPNEKPNIIFVFLESFRAKNIGCLGAEIPASPRFDELAQKGILFERFCANGLQTCRAFLASIFSLPPHLNTRTLKDYYSIPMIGLPDILKPRGYKTALIQGGSTFFDWTYPFFLGHGFDTILGKEDFDAPDTHQTSWGISDELLVRHAVEWIKKQNDPFFLSLFTISNHHPWDAPPNWHYPIAEQGLSPAYQRFLQTFSYTDHALGLFIDLLREKKILDHSLLFIMGDHGQAMGEREGSIDLHNDLYQENVHIPLLILGEGRGLKPQVIDTVASQMDLLPTLLDVLGIEAVHHSAGKSLIRETFDPVFLSLPQRKIKIGCMKGFYKMVHSENTGKDELFHLLQDPEERRNLAPDPMTETLKEEALSFFAEVERLFQEKKWAPAKKAPFELKATPKMTDAEWASFISASSSPLIVDLSGAFFLTDQAICNIGQERAASIHELNLSNLSLITDRSLEWVADSCPQLMMFNASHCPLLTDRSIQTLLSKCPQLRRLSLKEMDDLYRLGGFNAPNQINVLDLQNCRNLQGRSLAQFIYWCPKLVYLSASLESAEAEDLEEIGQNTQNLIYAWLTDGKKITDEVFTRFCERNAALYFLKIDGFPLLENPTLSNHQKIVQLRISDCPLLTDEILLSLNTFPLQEVRLERCPKITVKGLQRLLSLPRCKLIISECSGVFPEEIVSLRAQGLQIH
jgi:hypothetical protein